MAHRGSRWTTNGTSAPALCGHRVCPPETPQNGLASFGLCDFDSTKLVLVAAGRWLAVENDWPHYVEPRAVVVITEGPRTVGYFHVDAVDRTTIDSDIER